MKALSTAEDRIYKATLEARNRALVVMEDYVSEVERLYAAAAETLRKQIMLAADGEGRIDLQRAQALLASIQDTLKRMGAARDAVLKDALGDLAKRGVTDVAGMASVPVAAGIAFDTVAASAVNYVVHFMASDGLQLSDRLWRLDSAALQQVREAVERAVVLGSSADSAARELLRQGEPISDELRAKMGLSSAAKIGEEGAALFTGDGSPLYNAKRLFRTELNRAYSEGFRGMAAEAGMIGMKWNLSRSHKKTDICDTLASQDLYGMGPGVYPMDKLVVKPAHPLCLCFETAVLPGEGGQG